MPLTKAGRLPWLTKVIYGTGDWGVATFNTLRQIFYAIFLTDVVGLDPRLASFAALIGVIWDAVNDPLVGVISDRPRPAGAAAGRSCCSSPFPMAWRS